jgi:TPR repeat protein
MNLEPVVSWRLLLALPLAAATLVIGCGGGTVLSRPGCPEGQTSLDGTCVSQQIADYVACIRATGATVAAENAQSLSAAAGVAGATATTQAQVQDQLEKKYSSVSDANVLEIIHNCYSKTGASAVAVAEQQGSGGASAAASASPSSSSSPCGTMTLEDCNNLAVNLSNGTGMAQDCARAARAAEDVCTRGYPGGCRVLGALYNQGCGVAQDFARSAELSKQACEGGDLAACGNWGDDLAEGHGVARDAPRAVTLLVKSCDSPYAFACWVLGLATVPGGSLDLGLPKSRSKGVALVRKACVQGLPRACDWLRGQPEGR